MPKKMRDEMDKMTVAFIPHGFTAPIIYEVGSAYAERWMKNLLFDDDLVLRESCLDGVYLFSIKNPRGEEFNGFATHLYAMNFATSIFGNCFAVRIDEHKKVIGLTEEDAIRIERISCEYFKNRETHGE